ncbi:FmdB family zinc ribbon protein [Chloroflexota bacterium]
MPFYEFWCPKCEIEFEVQRSFSEYDKPAFCPNCQAEAEKLVSRFGTKVEFNANAVRKAFRKRKQEEAETAR